MLKTLINILINLIKLNLKESKMMTGWKTWLSGVGAIVYGVILIIGGHAEQGVTLILSGLGIIGIGHKIEKASK